MIHHVRLRPPSHDYPADEWNIIEKKFQPEFLPQLETMLALGNGYFGMRGCFEEGGPRKEGQAARTVRLSTASMRLDRSCTPKKRTVLRKLARRS
jgi:hypothetical protein